MQGQEFLEYFQKIPLVHNSFKGIYSINTIPKRLKVKTFIVCNTDLAHEPGQHWFIIFKPNKTTIEIFDSLGFDEEKQKSLKSFWPMKHISELYFNETPVQDKDSTLCGHYCVYFICERASNIELDLDELISLLFTSNCKVNDDIVKEFCHQLKNDN